MPDALRSMPDDWESGLAIVAHPDDLEYGAAGAIAAWTSNGHDLRYLLVTRGEAGIDTMDPLRAMVVREAEQRASAAIVGVSSVEFLDYRDGMIEAGLPLRRDLARQIRLARPELVLTLNHHDYWEFGGWNSADHRTVGRAVLDAVADAGNRWIFPELIDEGLEPWSGVRWIAVAASPRATHAVDISDTFDQAVASLAAHSSYLAALAPGDPEQQARDFLTGVTATTAERFGGKPAVTFELLAQ